MSEYKWILAVGSRGLLQNLLVIRWTMLPRVNQNRISTQSTLTTEQKLLRGRLVVHDARRLCPSLPQNLNTPRQVTRATMWKLKHNRQGHLRIMPQFATSGHRRKLQVLKHVARLPIQVCLATSGLQLATRAIRPIRKHTSRT